jgi:hypothetical protein
VRFHQLDDPAHQGTHSTFGVVDTVRALKMGDETVVRRRRERVTADQQRVKTEKYPEFFATKVSTDLLIDRPISAEPDQVGSRA